MSEILVVEGPGVALADLAPLFPGRRCAAWDAKGAEGRDALALIVPDGHALDTGALDRLPRLLAIGLLGTSLEGIDAAALQERDVALCIAEGALDTPIVEYVLLAALLLVRRAFLADDGGGGGGGDAGGELAGRTFGLLGVDRAARGVAYGARALGMTVVGHAPGVGASSSLWTDIAPLARGELLAGADVLSLHPPAIGDLGPHHLGKADIEAMKPGAVLVDASGRDNLDERALIAALDAGRLAGAALDRPGRAHPRLLRSDGRAARTAESAPRVPRLVARKVVAVLDRAG